MSTRTGSSSSRRSAILATPADDGLERVSELIGAELSLVELELHRRDIVEHVPLALASGRLAGVPGVDAPWLVPPGGRALPDVQYQWEGPPCTDAEWPPSDSLSWVSNPGVVCKGRSPVHAEPLNCGQLLISSLSFAQAVWDARPKLFLNGELSQQHYANVHKVKHTRTRRTRDPTSHTPHSPHLQVKYAHSPLPVEFYSYHWSIGRAGRARIRDPCGLVTYQ